VGNGSDTATLYNSSGDQEHQPCQKHQHGAQDQHLPPATAIRPGGDPQRDDGVAQQRQSQQPAHPLIVQPQRAEIQHQHDGQESVGEQAQPAGGKQPPTVGRERPQRLEVRQVQRHIVSVRALLIVCLRLAPNGISWQLAAVHEVTVLCGTAYLLAVSAGRTANK
jgi:hypothetical protein